MVSAYEYSTKDYLRYLLLKSLPSFCIKPIVKLRTKKEINKELNLDNPKTFTDKVNWLIRYNNNLLKTKLTDKLEAKKYVNKLIPELSTAKVFDIADSFDELDFDKCPDTFILKTNHAWKTNILIPDKNKLTQADKKALSKYYKRVLKINFAYWFSFELQYKDIIPKIYAEEFFTQDIEKVKNEKFSIKKAFMGFDILPDFEFGVYCLNGKPQFVTASYMDTSNPTDIHSCFKTYYPDKSIADFSLFPKVIEKSPPPTEILDYFDNILEYAKILAKNTKFVRVDFIAENNNLHFMELTFSPFSGLIQISSPEYDILLGKKLQI